ncbi:MAG TPA: carboxymuconolactone decarboxylase family protein [bacterium]|nr:carboxymuconolactone decarboxylase family protein [bacterium]
MEKQRLNYFETAPESYKTMKAFSDYLKTCGLEPPLLELIKIRASQMNGCAYCVDMHVKDARFAGETEERLYMLNAWRESDLYSDRERAALSWTEALTFLAETHAPKDAYDEVAKRFSPKEIADLTHAIAVINAWNRFMMAFRVPPGRYQPKLKG